MIVEVEEVKPYPLITDAIRRGSLDDLKHLFKKFPDFISLNVPGFGNWLIYASSVGSRNIVQYLIEFGFDVNSNDARGDQNPLSAAASAAKIENVDALLQNGAFLDTSTATLNPLFGAIIGKSLEIAKMILDVGIDTRKSYVFGSAMNPPLDAVAFAIMHGQRDIAYLIALRNSAGDEAVANASIAEGQKLAVMATIKSSD